MEIPFHKLNEILNKITDILHIFPFHPILSQDKTATVAYSDQEESYHFSIFSMPSNRMCTKAKSVCFRKTVLR